MLKTALAICRKDLRLILTRGAGLAQALLLGLLLIFLFSLSLDIGDRLTPQAAATMFWLASAFAMVLIFNMLYALEEVTSARWGLLLLPAPPQSIWLGKALGGADLILAAQIIFLPACIAFLGQSFGPAVWLGLGGILLADVGLAACGSLLGALSTGMGTGQAGRESLLSIILFPVLVPLLLAAIRLLGAAFSPDFPAETESWLRLGLAFNAVFVAVALVLFPFMYTGDD